MFLPALLARGWSVGGDAGLLLVTALLGALALLALYALATTVVGPRWALVGPVMLVLAPLQSWFSRDAYAELPVEFLALGGLWLLVEALRREDSSASVAAGAIAGVILGSITFARIDALAILVGIPVALAVEMARARPGGRDERRRQDRRALWSTAIALVATALLGLGVSRALSPGYLSDLANDLHLLELATATGVAGAVAVIAIHWKRPGIGHSLASKPILTWTGGALTVAIAVYAYVWRPRTGGKPHVAGSLSPAAARKVFDAYYFSASFRWFAWYFGLFALASAVAGIVVLGVRALRSDTPSLFLLAASMPVTVLFVARPSVSPDQLWAMRRFLPIVLPAMTIAAAAAAIWSTGAIAKWQPQLRVPAVGLVVAALLVPAALTGRPFLDAQMQGGALDTVRSICADAGPDAAIAVEPYAFLGAELPQTLRGFCGVPTAALLPDPGLVLGSYARQWKNAGRKLFMVTARRPAQVAAPNVIQVAHLVVADAREPERTLGRRPRRYAPRRIDVWLYRVDPT